MDTVIACCCIAVALVALFVFLFVGWAVPAKFGPLILISEFLYIFFNWPEVGRFLSTKLE